jgi:hypothetical protein
MLWGSCRLTCPGLYRGLHGQVHGPCATTAELEVATCWGMLERFHPCRRRRQTNRHGGAVRRVALVQVACVMCYVLCRLVQARPASMFASCAGAGRVLLHEIEVVARMNECTVDDEYLRCQSGLRCSSATGHAGHAMSAPSRSSGSAPTIWSPSLNPRRRCLHLACLTFDKR